MGTNVYSTSPPNLLTDVLDTHWNYVTQRILTLNPQRPLGGIVAARAWPFQQAIDQAIYMAWSQGKPSKNVNSQQSPLYTYSVRWCWIAIGDDLTQTEEGLNRGDRYRIDFQIQTELRYGLYPGFTPKLTFSVADNGHGQAVVTGTPFQTPGDNVWWSKATFLDREDTETGILFGYGAVNVSSFAPEINV